VCQKPKRRRERLVSSDRRLRAVACEACLRASAAGCLRRASAGKNRPHLPAVECGRREIFLRR
jgi:hypothetical protein